MSSLEKFLDDITAVDNIEGQFNYVYPMTTENIAGYLPIIDNFSKVLCVASSGDHLLNCVAMGAKEVTMFDANIGTYYLTQLKIAALNLDIWSFISFFTVDKDWDTYSEGFFNESIYKYIRQFIDDASVVHFWDLFYELVKKNNLTPQTSKLFRHMRHPRKTIVEANKYLEEDIYRDLRDRIKDVKIKFVNCDVTDLTGFHLGKEKYNTILLSNISDYIEGIFKTTGDDALDKFNEFTDSLVEKRLAFGGQLFFAYIYQATTGPGWTPIDDIKNLKKYFSNTKCKAIPAFCRRYTNDWSCVDCVLFKEVTW